MCCFAIETYLNKIYRFMLILSKLESKMRILYLTQTRQHLPWISIKLKLLALKFSEMFIRFNVTNFALIIQSPPLQLLQ